MAANEKNRKMTLDKLAEMMGRGFNAVDEKFDAVNKRLDGLETSVTVLTVDMRDVKGRLDKIEEKISELTGTLDAFLKRLIEREDEFAIMKREIGIMKTILKEKLNVDVDTLK